MLQFDALPLHDAVVEDIILIWGERTLNFNVLAFAESGKEASPYKLQFFGVSSFICLHQSSWGESSFVNQATELSGVYVIEMQSGDKIEIIADTFLFLSVAS